MVYHSDEKSSLQHFLQLPSLGSFCVTAVPKMKSRVMPFFYLSLRALSFHVTTQYGVNGLHLWREQHSSPWLFQVRQHRACQL